MRDFRELHESGLFVMPNAWDIGSARLLVSLGFEALATTSSGFAWSLGRLDQQVTRDELVRHVAALTGAVPVPLNVDSEHCFPGEPGGIAETARLLEEAGAAGFSIEDYDPVADAILDVDEAVSRVEQATGTSLVLTARAENYLHGRPDLDDTIARLVAYREAGADVVYAPGLSKLDEIERVVQEVGVPVNVLALPFGPPVPELASAGVRRVSTGGALAAAAYGALVAGARELQGAGTSDYVRARVTSDELRAAFG